MSLSVIIPSKNAWNLAACLNGICGGYERYVPGPIMNDEHIPIRVPPCPEVLVVDDSEDGAVANVCEHYEARRISSPTPFIFARNCNLGIQAAGQDDVILLNDDALLKTPGGFTAMQKQAEEHPEYGIISAVTNNAGNPAQFRQAVGLRAEPRTVAFICVLIPRRTIEKVGLLDERFTSYGWEDNDYCRRVREAGLKIGIYDGCFVDHASLNSTFRGGPHTAGDISAGAAIYRAKWGDLN